jgi:predicted Rossmann-fold nucleotide-binding protein
MAKFSICQPNLKANGLELTHKDGGGSQGALPGWDTKRRLGRIGASAGITVELLVYTGGGTGN